MSTGAYTTTIAITGTSPAAVGTAIAATPTFVAGLSQFDTFSITASLLGATGGTLDVVLQRKVATDVWVEWCRFPQLAAGATAKTYSVQPVSDDSITPAGIYTDAAVGTQTLAANTCCGCHPGDTLRMVFVAGASTSAGAVQTVYITGICQQ